MTIELQAQPREVFGKKVKSLREAGLIPAEIYGRKIKNQSIQAPAQTLSKVLDEAGNTNLIAVKVDKQKPVQVLARNIQYSTIKQNVLHVDFYAVVMDETVNVAVPIYVIGESPLLKEGGTLVTGINDLDIEALPGNLPESVEVDISGIESFSKSISVADLTVPDDIIVHSSPESMVVMIQPPRLIEEEEEEEVLEEEGVEVSAEVPTIRDEQEEEE